MDPFSIAASLAGLVSLSLQVAELAGKVNDSVKAWKSAHKDAEGLSRTLDHVSRLCLWAKSIMEVGNPSVPTQPPREDTIAQMTIALDQCQNALCRIDAELAGWRASLTGNSARTILRSRSRKENIAELEREMLESMGVLKDLIFMDTWSLVSHQFYNNIYSTQRPLNALPTAESEPTRCPAGLLAVTKSVSCTRRMQTVTSRRTWLSVPILGSIQHCFVKQQVVGHSDASDAVDEVTHTVDVDLRLLSYSIELRQHRLGCAPPRYSLRTIHIVAFNTIARIITSGTVHDLQRFLCSGKASIYSLDSRFKCSMFYCAAMFERTEVCQFLLEQDNTRELIANSPAHPPFRISHRRAKVKVPLDMFFRRAGTEVYEEQMLFFLRMMKDPKMLLHEIPRFAMTVTSSERQVFLIWKEAFWTYLDSRSWFYPEYLADADDWRELFVHLIRQGVNPSSIKATIFRILSRIRCPYQLLDVMGEWLSFLEAADVDLAAYLALESSYCEKKWDEPNVEFSPWYRCRSMRMLAQAQWQQYSVPCWVWWNDPSSDAFDLLEEFKDLGPGISLGNEWIDGMVGGTSHCEWKQDIRYSDEVWPFVLDRMTFRLLQIEEGGRPSILSDGRQSFNAALRLRQERFERRQARRCNAYLTARKKGRMPGAWID